MHSLDRRWRWFFWCAVLCAACGIALAAFVLVALALRPPSPAGAFAIAHTWLLWIAAFLPMIGADFWVWAQDGRAREAVRSYALMTGELDVMPFANGTPDQARAVDLAAELLSLIWRTPFGHSGVIATDEGLVWRRPLKRDVVLRWTDARLLEVRRDIWSDKEVGGYCLYADSRVYVEWRKYAYADGTAIRPTNGVSFAEMRRHQRALLDTIAARTGLVPRTLAPQLMKPAPPDMASLRISIPKLRQTMRSVWLAGYIPFFMGGMASLGLAVATLALPLTHSLVLNVYTASTMAGLGLLVLATCAMSLSRVLRSLAPGAPPSMRLPSAPPLENNLALGRPAQGRVRLRAAVVGLLLAANAYPSYRAYADFPPDLITGLDVAGNLRILVSVLIGAVCFLMAFFCALIVTLPMPEVIADDLGLHLTTGKRRVALSWGAIEQLVAHISFGTVRYFEAIAGDADRTTIRWRGRARWLVPRELPSTGDAAAEMAALVAQRTGLSLTVVRHA